LLVSAVEMPIYEYVCMKCESHFEELVRNGEDPGCPDCGAEKVARQFSVFAAVGTSGESSVPSFKPRGGGGCCGGSCGCGH
jgi:putative FmdB family regulatory protein